MQKCFICGVKTNIIEYHHLVPQAAGGKNLPTIPLCSNCHSGIHRVAAQAISKNPNQKQYFTDAQMIKARPIIETIIISFKRAKENPDKSQIMNLMLKPERRLMEVLHLLKYDKGFTNINDYCLWILKTHAVNQLR